MYANDAGHQATAGPPQELGTKWLVYKYIYHIYIPTSYTFLYYNTFLLLIHIYIMNKEYIGILYIYIIMYKGSRKIREMNKEINDEEERGGREEEDRKEEGEKRRIGKRRRERRGG